jgi:hypothetical protein
MPNTFEDYIVAVKSKYEVEKDKIYSDFLLKPSPAQLREFCLLIHDNGLTNKDREVFELFFKTKPDQVLRKLIENVDVEKFRKICNFLNGKSLTTSQNSLNLIAILVNYEFRPFSYFLKSEINLENQKINKRKKEEEPFRGNEINRADGKKNLKKKIAIGLFGLIGIGSVGYAGKSIVFSEPECMQWQKNHFEVVDCQSEKQKGFMMQSEIIPFNENQSQLFKIEVSDTTTFFKNEKPLYWYCKVNGKPEFFNTHGIHPETGKALKPVSQYIIDKYVK